MVEVTTRRVSTAGVQVYGEASDSVKDSGANGGGQRTLKLADYICGRRQERGNMTRVSGDGNGEWGHNVSGEQVEFQWDVGSRSWEQRVLEEKWGRKGSQGGDNGRAEVGRGGDSGSDDNNSGGSGGPSAHSTAPPCC